MNLVNLTLHEEHGLTVCLSERRSEDASGVEAIATRCGLESVYVPAGHQSFRPDVRLFVRDRREIRSQGVVEQPRVRKEMNKGEMDGI